MYKIVPFGMFWKMKTSEPWNQTQCLPIMLNPTALLELVRVTANLQQMSSTDCSIFHGITCPCKEGTRGCETSTDVGDVLKPAYQNFEFPLYPDPTKSDLPKHMYDNDCLKNGNGYQVYIL